VEDILITCVDGMKGFPEAIQSKYSQMKVQLCIVHMVRGSLKYVSWKDCTAVTGDLKRMQLFITEAQAQLQPERLAVTRDAQYPKFMQSCCAHWFNLIMRFEYLPEGRCTNAIESLNSAIRKATKRRKLFLNDDVAVKSCTLRSMLSKVLGPA
jgi:putative transposase